MSRTYRDVTLEYQPYGGALELFGCTEPEILFEGPAGTGKSRATAEYLNFMCESYPGIRCLMLRQTRKSLAESVQVTFENKVLWPDHPLMLDAVQRRTRHSYKYPNGSEIVLGGMDNPERLYSTEYDIVWVEEAIEVSLDAWEKLVRMNRNYGNKHLKYQQMIATTNPGSQYHWLNRRANDGKVHRILSSHMDNPEYFDQLTQEPTEKGKAYLGRLSRLSGPRRDRLFLGLWVAEEGLVYECWEPARHIVPREGIRERCRWFIGSVDWGFRNPGCFQVWGIDEEQRMYRLEEIYRAEQSLDWWAEKANDLNVEYDLRMIVCDPAEPRSIEVFNDRISVPRNRGMAYICRKADNDILAGTDMMRWALQDGRMFFCEGSLREGRDPLMRENGQPCCTEEELPGIVWMKNEDGKPQKEKPDPSCADHGENAARYAAMAVWKRDLSDPEPEPCYQVGTFGHLLGHTEFWGHLNG